MLLVLRTGCTAQGEEVLTTFHDPTANPSGTPPTSSGNDTEDTGDNGTETHSQADSGTETGSESTATPESTETSGSPVDEQPDSGLYSECSMLADCIGLDTCVLVTGAEGAGGFCTRDECMNPAAECGITPGESATALPACVANGKDMVCALRCTGEETCPGGMQCLALGAEMVCA